MSRFNQKFTLKKPTEVLGINQTKKIYSCKPFGLLRQFTGWKVVKAVANPAIDLKLANGFLPC